MSQKSFNCFRTTSNLNNERVLETVSDKEPQCNLLEKHDSSTVVGNTADSRKELDELHVMKEKSHNSPDASVDKPPTGNLECNDQLFLRCIIQGRNEGESKGEQFPGRQNVPTMSQVLPSIQYTCFRNSSGSNTGPTNLLLAPGAI